MKLVLRFQDIGTVEDFAECCQPHVRKKRSSCVTSEMKTLAHKLFAGTSSGRETARCLCVPISSIHGIMNEILDLYLFNLRSYLDLLPADAKQIEPLGRRTFSNILQDSTWAFHVL